MHKEEAEAEAEAAGMNQPHLPIFGSIRLLQHFFFSF